MSLIEKTNIVSYDAMYSNMEHDHAYPNVNLVRLEKWYFDGPGRTLDHGFGYGENLFHLVRQGYQVHGVEISEKLLNWVTHKAKIKQIPATSFNLSLLKDENKLSFESGFFNYVVSLGVLEMLGTEEAASNCVSELARVLERGGKAIISTLAVDNSFIQQAVKISSNTFRFQGTEMDKTTNVEFNLFVPQTIDDFEQLLKEYFSNVEVGSWGNNYMNVNGEHWVGLCQK